MMRGGIMFGMYNTDEFCDTNPPASTPGYINPDWRRSEPVPQEIVNYFKIGSNKLQLKPCPDVKSENGTALGDPLANFVFKGGSSRRYRQSRRMRGGDANSDIRQCNAKGGINAPAGPAKNIY